MFLILSTDWKLLLSSSGWWPVWSQLVNIGACKTLKHFAFSRKNLSIWKYKSLYFDFIHEAHMQRIHPNKTVLNLWAWKWNFRHTFIQNHLPYCSCKMFYCTRDRPRQAQGAKQAKIVGKQNCLYGFKGSIIFFIIA